MSSDARSQHPAALQPGRTLAVDTNPFIDGHPETFVSSFKPSLAPSESFEPHIREAHLAYREDEHGSNCPVDVGCHTLKTGGQIPQVTLSAGEKPWHSISHTNGLMPSLTVNMSDDSPSAGPSSQAAPTTASTTAELRHQLTRQEIQVRTCPSTLEYGFHTGIRDVHHNADPGTLTPEESTKYATHLQVLRKLSAREASRLLSQYEKFIVAPEPTMPFGSFTPSVTEDGDGGKDVTWQFKLSDGPGAAPVLGWARHGLYLAGANETRLRLGYADFPVWYDPSGSEFETHIEATR